MSRNVTPIDRSRAGVLGDVDLFRELAEQSGDVLAMGSDTGSIGYVSPAVGPMLGYAPSELSGRHVLRYVFPADAVRVRAAWGRAQQAGVRICFVAFRPRPGTPDSRGFEIDPEILEVIANAGMLHLDLRERRRSRSSAAAAACISPKREPSSPAAPSGSPRPCSRHRSISPRCAGSRPGC